MLTIIAGVTILLLVAWLIAAALRKSSAALRHVVWTSAIGATLLYPPVHWCVSRRVITRPIQVMLEPARVMVDSGRIAGRVGTAGGPQAGILTVSEIALAIWGLGSMLLAIRFSRGALQVQRLMNDAQRLERPFPVPILISRRIPGPLVAGIFRPRIVLPENSADWSSPRRRAVLAHELAHIRRRDPAILFVAQLATIVYWFHPLCWFAAAQLRRESECACDNAVLRIGLRPSKYAEELLDLARLFNPQPAIPMAAASHLESRVKSILDPLVKRSFAATRTWLAAAVITAALSAPLCIFTLRAQEPGQSGAPVSQTAGRGTIKGTITDPTGAVVAAVQVLASNLGGGNTEIANADALGNFTFGDIPSGNYAVEVHAPGFAPYRQDVALASGSTVSAPVRLKVGDIGEQITVVAAGSAKSSLPSTAPGSGPIRVGGNVQAASLIQQVRPVYPGALQAAGIEGTVLMEAVISKDGVPISLKPQNTSVDPAFVSAAMDAVQQWRYRPTLLNGEPIEVLTTIRVDFKLQPNGVATNH